MPLSVEKKAQSESIEDLIAQLDAAPPSSASNHGEESNDSLKNSSSSGSNARRVLKGKRTSGSSSSNGATCGTAAGCASGGAVSSFAKTNSFGQNSEPVLSKNILMSKKYTKHMRSLNNRGMPKKGGAGGKHTWGAPGCELNSEDYIDANDPNYDSEEAGNVVMVCVENSDGGAAQRSRAAARMNDGDEDNDGSDGSLKELDLEDMECEIKPVRIA